MIHFISLLSMYYNIYNLALPFHINLVYKLNLGCPLVAPKVWNWCSMGSGSVLKLTFGTTSSSMCGTVSRSIDVGLKVWNCPRVHKCDSKHVDLRQFKKKSTLLPPAGNLACLSWVRHSSHKGSATHSYQCVQYFHVLKQWYGCQCLGFLTCA